ESGERTRILALGREVAGAWPVDVGRLLVAVGVALGDRLGVDRRGRIDCARRRWIARARRRWIACARRCWMARARCCWIGPARRGGIAGGWRDDARVERRPRVRSDDAIGREPIRLLKREHRLARERSEAPIFVERRSILVEILLQLDHLWPRASLRE